MARTRASRKGRKAGAGKGAGARRQGSGSAALRFGRMNAVLGLAGLVSLVLGYMLLAQGSITAAPLLLVLGYVVLLPLAIIV